MQQMSVDPDKDSAKLEQQAKLSSCFNFRYGLAPRLTAVT